ncbi:hydroquinone glucosyltransferase isoform X2 [Populus alba]|uniref:hydroquinone glucosyltransferase isoform X2 n=1 Tax=Populus alba TaxID=43335 RepID=UPI001588B4B6|nr:hydroquinone glucosyltransferase-like isoform X2 [Populus alba]
MTQKPHVAIFPSPGMGHLIPLTELAKKFALNYDLSSTFIVPSIGPPPEAQKKVLGSLPEGINYISLPPVSFDDLPGIRAETQISLTITRSLSSVRDVLKSLAASTRLVALVLDLFGTDVIDIASELSVPSYIASLSTGCGISVHGRDLPDPIQDRKDDAYKWFLHHSKRHSLAEGILLNSFVDLEPETIKALQDQELGNLPPIYPVGPIIYSGSSIGASGHECLQWMDDQPNGSVLYISFGSGGTLSFEQLNELAMGLEISEQKFLWVVRSPDKSASASYFSATSNTDPYSFLPKGFLDRTKGQGLVVPSWAPQIQVLSHGSTGGFLTHCGWNSTLESIVHGVPLIAWPLYAEQKTNAVLLSAGLKVALRPEVDGNGLVGREEIAKVVKGLMQGEEGAAIRRRMKGLKEAAAKAVSEEGSSTKSLHELVSKWKN